MLVEGRRTGGGRRSLVSWGSRPRVAVRLLVLLAAVLATSVLALTSGGATTGAAPAGDEPPPTSIPRPAGPAGGTCAPLDLVLVLDTSTSMDPAIGNVKDQLVGFLDVVEQASGGDYRLGLIDFGRRVTVHVPLAAGNRAAVAAAIPELRQGASNWNDPEAWDEALRTAVETRAASETGPEGSRWQDGDFSVDWRPEAEKLVVLVSDARPAGWDDDFDADDLRAAEATARQARDAGIRVTTIFVPNRNAEEDAANQLRTIADLAGGAYRETAPDGANLTDGLDLAVRTCGADSDGDGLYDSWESEGIDHDGDGTIDVDLPAMGADPQRRDLFLQVSWMGPPTTGRCRLVVFCSRPPAGFDRPSMEALERLGDAYAGAPLDNPDGSTGISLHVDAGPATPDRYGIDPQHRRGGELPETEWAEPLFTTPLPDDPTVAAWDRAMAPLDALQARWVPEERRAAFTWVLYVPAIEVDRPKLYGIARGIPSDVVVINARGAKATNLEAAVLFHELGHTLGLQHGGGDGMNQKPNYLSVMNYDHALRGGLVIEGRTSVLDFSHWSVAPLDERSLDETVGIPTLDSALPIGIEAVHHCDPFDANGNGDLDSRSVPASLPIDWNCDGDRDDIGFSAPIVPRQQGSERYEIEAWDDWDNITFTGGVRGGLVSQTIAVAPEDGFDDDAYRAIPKHHAVEAEGGGTVTAAPGATDLTVAVRVANLGTEHDRYTIEVQADGLDDATATDASIELASEEAAAVAATFDVPADAAPDDGVDRALTLVVRSASDPAVSASATFVVQVDPMEDAAAVGGLTIEPDEVDRGETLEVTGEGFAPDLPVTVWTEPALSPPLVALPASDGSIAVSVSVPDEASTGIVEVFAGGVDATVEGSPLVRSGQVVVQDPEEPPSPAAEPPPDTDDGGGSGLLLVVLGLVVAVAAGAAAYLVAKRRRSDAPPPVQ